MDGLIVYGSKYGTTRRYAEELSRLTGLSAIPCREFRGLAEGHILVYLGALYAGGVLGLKQAMKGLSLGDGQRLIVATVGLADPNNPQNRAHILASLKRQMSPVLFSQAIFFHLRGGIDYAVLSPRHRAMMAAMCFSLRRKPARQRSSEDQALLETYGKQIDFTDLSALAPIAREILRGYDMLGKKCLRPERPMIIGSRTGGSDPNPLAAIPKMALSDFQILTV